MSSGERKKPNGEALESGAEDQPTTELGDGLKSDTPAASGDFWVKDDDPTEAPTVEMPPGEMAKKVAANQDRKKVEVSGEVGVATQELAWQIQADAEATLDVPRPKVPAPKPHCRMCGRVVGIPSPRRIRGPIDSGQGFRCERCQNIFCAGHIVRVTPIVRSLIGPARFCCQLCLPESEKLDEKP